MLTVANKKRSDWFGGKHVTGNHSVSHEQERAQHKVFRNAPKGIRRARDAACADARDSCNKNSPKPEAGISSNTLRANRGDGEDYSTRGV